MEEAGGLRIEQKANAVLKSILAEYMPPLLEESIHEELVAFMENAARGRGTNRFLGFIGENIPWQKKCRIRPESPSLWWRGRRAGPLSPDQAGLDRCHAAGKVGADIWLDPHAAGGCTPSTVTRTREIAAIHHRSLQGN